MPLEAMKKNSTSTLVTVLITCLVFANFFLYSKIFTNTIPEPSYQTAISPDADDVNHLEEQPAKDGALTPDYKHITANLSDTRSGSLILVNTKYPYTFDNVPTVVAKENNESIYYSKTTSYSVRDIEVSMNTVAITALNKMLDDFYAYQGNKKSIIVTQGHRSYEEQQAMLQLKIEQFGPDQKIAQQPGASEHHTGYAMDISLYENNIMATFTGEDEYAWIFENAHKYGFVLRYPADKVDVTGINYESWHFRYVGVPHAEYMYVNGKTLEEYIEILALYPFESEHLKVTDSTTGTLYEIYSVPVAADGTRVPVPSMTSANNKFTLSGDNAGHLIVTVKCAA